MFTAKGSNDLSDQFLKRLFAIHSKNPEKISEADIFTTCITNIGAGSDSTSVSLTAILYNLCKHQKVYRKLREEVELVATEGRISGDEITFHEAQALLYLQACIKEGLRLYPATGLPLARVVPKGGATLSGKYFPEGEIVGVNAWVSNRKKAVFGNDAAFYRLERWLENPAKVSEMDRNFLSFGAGARTFIGKNISLMEMGKLIPALIRRFDFELVDLGTEVTTQNVWFIK